MYFVRVLSNNEKSGTLQKVKYSRNAPFFRSMNVNSEGLGSGLQD